MAKRTRPWMPLSAAAMPLLPHDQFEAAIWLKFSSVSVIMLGIKLAQAFSLSVNINS